MAGPQGARQRVGLAAHLQWLFISCGCGKTTRFTIVSVSWRTWKYGWSMSFAITHSRFSQGLAAIPVTCTALQRFGDTAVCQDDTHLGSEADQLVTVMAREITRLMEKAVTVMLNLFFNFHAVHQLLSVQNRAQRSWETVLPWRAITFPLQPKAICAVIHCAHYLLSRVVVLCPGLESSGC